MYIHMYIYIYIVSNIIVHHIITSKYCNVCSCSISIALLHIIIEPLQPRLLLLGCLALQPVVELLKILHVELNWSTLNAC